MAANTRPYFIIYNGVSRMVEAPNPAAAVRHVVGAAVTELRPARGAEVANWVRGNNTIELAGEKTANTAAEATMPEVTEQRAASEEVEIDPDHSVAALKFFEDWAGFDRNAKSQTKTSEDTVKLFCSMHVGGQLDLMTFDVLRERAPEFGSAMVALEANIPRCEDLEYVAAVVDAEEVAIARLRSRLEEAPMPSDVVIRAVLAHAGQPAE